jgi:hypothetical protein
MSRYMMNLIVSKKGAPRSPYFLEDMLEVTGSTQP